MNQLFSLHRFDTVYVLTHVRVSPANNSFSVVLFIDGTQW